MSNDDVCITPDEFVQEFKDLKSELVNDYFSDDPKISRVKILEDSGLSKDQIELTKSIVDEALTDALYTILLGLEGSASISRHQIMYKLFDEGSNELTGEIETIAWEKFHGEYT